MASEEQPPQPTASPNGEVVETINATLEPGQAPQGLESPTNEPYDADRQRDTARANITYWLLGLLTLLILLAFIFVCALKDSPTFEQLKNLVEVLLGPVVALVSAATGFYFGAQSRSGQGKDS